MRMFTKQETKGLAGVKYLVIYEKDILNLATQDSLRYAHGALHKK